MNDVKLIYVGRSERDGAKFWLKRVGNPSSFASRIDSQRTNAAGTSRRRS
jgi:hypothetical protein